MRTVSLLENNSEALRKTTEVTVKGTWECDLQKEYDVLISKSNIFDLPPAL